MKRLKTNHHMLHVLKKSKPKLRQILLKNCNSEVIKTICEIAINILNGNHKVSKHTFKHLNKNKKILRCLACPKKSINIKRKLIIQKGGFLPMLIGSVLSGVVGDLLSKYFKNE